MVERLQKYEDWARACMHVRCGFCRENCPMYSQFHLDSYSAKGKLTMLYHWLKGNLNPDASMAERVYACTSCGLCDVACGYSQSTAIQDMKTELFESGIAPSGDYLKIITRTSQIGNPYGENEKLGRKYLESIPEAHKADADLTLFLGCTEIYRGSEQVKDLLKILRAAGQSFNVIPENVCCGSPVKRVGDQKQATAQARKVSQMLRDMKAKEVLVSCSGCYRTLSNEYSELIGEDLGIPIIHSIQLIDRMMAKNQLNLGEVEDIVTYHDPCHLGRHSEIYDEPRRILSAIPGVELMEMEWNRKFSKCCGAGGGFKAGKAEDAVEIASRRIQEAEATGASILTTACPFCLRNLRDGAELVNSVIEVCSVESLVARSLQ